MATYTRISDETRGAAWFLARGRYQRRLLLGTADWQASKRYGRNVYEYRRSAMRLLRRLTTNGFSVRCVFAPTLNDDIYIITSRMTGR